MKKENTSPAGAYWIGIATMNVAVFYGPAAWRWFLAAGLSEDVSNVWASFAGVAAAVLGAIFTVETLKALYRRIEKEKDQETRERHEKIVSDALALKQKKEEKAFKQRQEFAHMTMDELFEEWTKREGGTREIDAFKEYERRGGSKAHTEEKARLQNEKLKSWAEEAVRGGMQ